MAQPPPRKGAFAKQCQITNKDQYSKLQLKVQQENDLLEDVRTFVKQKAIIEKQYADSMLKLSGSTSHKRIASLLDINEDPASGVKSSEKNIYTIWKHLLDENEKIAKARLAAVQVLQEEVEKDAKVLRNTKQSHAKKALERLGIVQKEIQQTVAEVDRTKRAYFDDESSAHDVRDKAKDADDRSKGKKKDVMSLFHSKSTLKKHAGKLSAKQEECDIRSTGARNDYILSLASANAHQDFYFKHDLQETIRNCELNFYEKISTYLNTVARAEVLTTTAVLSSFSNIRDQAERITRDYNYNCYMQAYPCFREHINYDLEPCDGDSTTIITTSEHDGGYSLNYEARQNASKLNQASKTIKAYNKRIQACHYHKTKGLKQEPNDTGGPDLNTKIIELQIAIRNAEMEKVKAEARLEKLREGGISVDEYINADVYAPTPQASEPEKQTVQQREPETSKPLQRSGTDDQDDEWPTTNEQSQEEVARAETPDYEEQPREETQQPAQGSNDGWASWDQQQQQQNYDYNQGWAEFDHKQEEAPQQEQEQQESTPAPQITSQISETSDQVNLESNCGQATVLYNFDGHAADELTVTEQECIYILYNECDEEGWVMAQNSKGEKGYVPQNYLELEALPMENGGESTSGMSSSVPPEDIIPEPQQQVPQEVVSAEVTAAEDPPDDSSEASSEASSSSGPPSDLPPPPPPPSVPQQQSSSPAVRPSSMALSSSGPSEYCKALYDYEATGSDEITFLQGQVIRILNKDPNGINDGWWLGEPYEGGNGRAGLFPSIVVEGCLENGESADESSETDSSVDSPDSSIAPPCFTPPGMESRKNNMMIPGVVAEEDKPLEENCPGVVVEEDKHLEENCPGVEVEKEESKERSSSSSSSSSEEEIAREKNVGEAAPLMPPIMVTNPTPMAPSVSQKEEEKDTGKDPAVNSFSVEAPNFEITMPEEIHEIYTKTATITKEEEVPPFIPPAPPPPPAGSLNATEIVVTAPTPKVQSPVLANENAKKRTIIEELKQHPAFKERNKVSDETHEPKEEPKEQPKEEPKDAALTMENKIEEIQKKIEPAVQEIEQKALSVAKEATKKPIPTITMDPPHSSDDDEEDENSDKQSSDSESGPDVVSSSEEEEDLHDDKSINPLPPDELEMRQLKKLDKLKESTA